jgi:hypothetical protein
MYTGQVVPSGAPWEPAITNETSIYTLATLAQYNGHCHSYRDWSVVANPSISYIEVRSDIVDGSAGCMSFTPYSFQSSAEEPKVTDDGHDLVGIGAQFSGSEYQEHGL